MKTLFIASDHAGFALKENLKPYLEKIGFQVKDLGPFSDQRCDYPAYAYNLALRVSGAKFPKGILICKSGVGNSIVANKVPGVRAALCHNITCARLSRQHNNSNVLVLGSAFVNAGLARRIAGVWVKTEFLGGRHARRLNQIKRIEKELGSRIR